MRSMVVEVLSRKAGARASTRPFRTPSPLRKHQRNLVCSPLPIGAAGRSLVLIRNQILPKTLSVLVFESHAQAFSTPLARRRSSYPSYAPNLVLTYTRVRPATRLSCCGTFAGFRLLQYHFLLACHKLPKNTTHIGVREGRTWRNFPDTTELLGNEPAGSRGQPNCAWRSTNSYSRKEVSEGEGTRLKVLFFPCVDYVLPIKFLKILRVSNARRPIKNLRRNTRGTKSCQINRQQCLHMRVRKKPGMSELNLYCKAHRELQAMIM